MRAYIEINKQNLINNYKKIKEQTNKEKYRSHYL